MRFAARSASLKSNLPARLEPNRPQPQSAIMSNGSLPEIPSQLPTPKREARLYVPDHEGWAAAIKRDWTKEYCFSQNPGENHYHLLLSGEIYLERAGEKYCLNCAMRHGVITTDRTFWQKGPSSVPDTPLASKDA
jgi:hypothetical protein